MSVRFPRPTGRARGRSVLLALALAAIAPATAAAAPCSDFTSGTPSYTVRLCLTAPADGATLTADSPVSATVTTIAGTSPGVQRVVFSVDGQYLLTDYTTPYTFTLPTNKFVDGPRVLAAEALLRDGTTTAPQASISTTFATGTLTPPVNSNTFQPKVANPPANTSLVVGAAGDGAGGEQSAADVVSLVSNWNPSLFLYLGDVYEKGSVAEYANWFGPSGSPGVYYGRLKSITDPTVGNHEYTGGQAPGYFDYWDNVPHYYSFNAGSWHFISLDANSAFGQTATTSPQYQWLQNDLRTNPQPCTVAYFHQPLFNIGQEGPATSMTDIWSLLASRGVDLVVNGHDHTYQRWQPMDGLGNPSPTGMTELVAGMGGHAHGRWLTTDSRVVASDNTHFGALRLDLNSAGAGYQFVSTGGQVYDSGSVKCNPATADTTAPTAPTGLLGVGTYKTSVSLRWTAGYDTVGITAHQIFRDGQPLATVGPQTSYTDDAVAAGSTHTYQVRAVDAAGNVSPPSNLTSATTPLNAVLFHDGFESNDLSAWSVSSGLVVQPDNVFAGTLAAEAAPVAAPPPYAMKQLASPEQDLYYATRFKVIDQPSGNINLLRFRAANSPSYSSLATFFVTSTGRIGMRNDVTAVSTTSTAGAPRGVWHTLQAHVVVNGSANQTEVWLDGILIPALTATNVSFGIFTGVGQVELSAKPSSSSTYDVAFDEVAYDRQPIGDATPPDAPGSFTATAHSGLRVDLSWAVARDDIGASGYDVYRDGLPIASIGPVTSWQDLTVAPLTSYTYAVVARDAAGNVSLPSNSLSVTTPDAFTDAFETGDLSRWTTSSGVAVQSAVVDGGAFAARATSDGTAGASAVASLDATIPELYFRARFQVVSRGANSVGLVRVRSAANGALASAFVSSTGKLGLRNDVTGLSTTSAVSVTSGVWHEIQLHVVVSDTVPQADVWLDGQLAATRTDSLGGAPAGKLELGDPSLARPFDVAFDNVIADAGFVADVAAPTAPPNLRTTAVAGNEVDLAWDDATDDVGVTAYRVYRNGLALADVDGATLSYADTMVTDGTPYTYVVTALDAVNHESPITSSVQVGTQDVTAPAAPTGLTASAVPGQGEIDLVWTAATDNVGVASYALFRDGGSTAIGTTTGTTYADTTVASISTHTYAVQALDAAGNVSALSAPATATAADTAAPSAPGMPAVAPLSDSQLKVTWTAASDDVAVAGYRVFRNGGATPVTTVPAGTTAFTDTGLLAGTAYTYDVRAFDAAGNLSAPGTSAATPTALFTDGFEVGNLSRWQTVSGLTVQKTTRYAGLWAAESQSKKNSLSFASKTLPAPVSGIWMRERVLLPKGKLGLTDMLRLRTAAGGNLLALYHDPNGRVGVLNDTRGTARLSAATLAQNVWYEVKVHLVVNGSASTAEVFLNGTRLNDISTTAEAYGSTPVGQVVAGESTAGRAYDTLIDEVFVDTRP